jgi:hypothetical protein
MATRTGSCACGAVRFELAADFLSAGYCHCTRCQRRSGAPASLNGIVPDGGLTIVAGEEALRVWRPREGMPKWFCGRCGGHVFAGEPGAGGVVGVRFGTLHDDPGIEPSWRQWVSSSPPWLAIPDDGIPRYPEQRPT